VNDRVNEWNMLITTAEAEKAEFLAGGRPAGMSEKEYAATLAGMDRQIADYTRQRQEILNAERKAERARKEAEEIAERQKQAELARIERERQAAEAKAKADEVLRERKRIEVEKARADRMMAEARQRQEAVDQERRKRHAEQEAAMREKKREAERLASLGAVLTGPNGEEATKYRLKVPGGHVEVRFIPSGEPDKVEAKE